MTVGVSHEGVHMVGEILARSMCCVKLGKTERK